MKIGIYADDPGQVISLTHELATGILWVAGPDLVGDFPFPVYRDYDLAIESEPVALVIDCIGDLQDPGVMVVPVAAAFSLLGAGKGQSMMTTPGTAFTAASSQLQASIDKILIGLTQLNNYSERISQVGEKINGAAEGIAGDLERTNRILDAITRIAKRSKIIGLNSAIEAARVGEQGRGFAVVAEEIKTLADDSAQSLLNIGRILDGIQQRSHELSEGTSSVVQLTELQQQAATDISVMMEALKELGQDFKLLVQGQPA
jgi:hypothetical protein